jgi:hypothetical protein
MASVKRRNNKKGVPPILKKTSESGKVKQTKKKSVVFNDRKNMVHTFANLMAIQKNNVWRPFLTHAESQRALAQHCSLLLHQPKLGASLFR